VLRFWRRHKAELQLALVYIQEAHASDEWPMKWSFERPSPKSLVERITNADEVREVFAAPFEVPVLVDGMGNDFNKEFCAWPACYYDVDRTGTLLYVWQGEEDEAHCAVNDVFKWIRRQMKQ
jgi:hypothetical protein